MHIDPRDLPELFNRWLTAIAELLTGSKAGKPALKVDGLRSGYKQRKEQLLQRLADNEAIRAILIKHRARLLEQLQQARLTTSDLRLGENRLKMGDGNDGKSGAPATQALPVQAPDAKASPPGESFSMPEVELDGEGELDQDISSDQVSELLDIDENGDAIVAQNDRVQIRERAGKGVERVITQVSSRVYEGSTLISKSDHISRLDLDAGNIVKVRFSDGFHP